MGMTAYHRHLRQPAPVICVTFADASFDAVFSANSIFFWPDQSAGVREIRRVLKPGGHIVLILQPTWAKSDKDVQAIAEEYQTMLSTEGYQQVRSAFHPMRPVACIAVLGNK
jgi:ubiquinone/menaquinone biosynthesis C-methylase UbiE